MATIRRAELAQATFEVLQLEGLRKTTVARISDHAGLTQGLVHHYFKSKSEMIEAAIRLASTRISEEAVNRLKRAHSPRQRLNAIIDANLAPAVMTPPVTQAWIAFAAEAAHDPAQQRILRIIERRMQSNLRSCLRPLVPEESVDVLASGISMMIDGAWQRCALSDSPTDNEEICSHIMTFVDAGLSSLAGAVKWSSEEATDLHIT